MVPPWIVIPDSVSVSPASIARVAPLAVSANVVFVTVSSSSVSAAPLATVTSPLFRLALLILLAPLTSMAPPEAPATVPFDGAAADR